MLRNSVVKSIVCIRLYQQSLLSILQLKSQSALLDSRVPVVSIAVPGVVFEKVLSNAQEAMARDAQLIGVAPQGPDTDLFDELLPVPSVSEWISPLLTVVPMQLLSYHIAAHRGLDVDQPRNLAKSCLLYTSPSPRDRQKSRMPSSA